jgi:hypothetical protein
MSMAAMSLNFGFLSLLVNNDIDEWDTYMVSKYYILQKWLAWNLLNRYCHENQKKEAVELFWTEGV